jgi:exopolyphosphatase/guanosine-5'-triphosphate,3'-diphosphate pyrophosphatase
MEKATPRPPLSPADFPVDIVRLAASCGAEYGHALHVAALCEKLFGALDALHRFSDTEKKWLRCAALLHDIGWIDGQKKHHKNSLNRILEADLPSLSPEEKIVVGLLARYHRKALPKDSHPHFGSLSAARKDTVKKLAALLRLADGLDRTHAARIRELSCVLEKNRVRLLVTRAASFSETDLMTGKKKSDLFEEAFGKKLRIEWSSEGRPA